MKKSKQKCRFNKHRAKKELLVLWGRAIRKRDGKCQWCGKTDNLHAHHIVARGGGSVKEWSKYEWNNGVTLCWHCHFYKLKQDSHAYVEWLDSWLEQRDLSYSLMKHTYTADVPAFSEKEFTKDFYDKAKKEFTEYLES